MAGSWLGWRWVLVVLAGFAIGERGCGSATTGSALAGQLVGLSIVGSAQPTVVRAGALTHLIAHVTPGVDPASTAIRVVADTTAIGGPPQTALEDTGLQGGGCDDIAGDNTFIQCATVTIRTAPGIKVVPVTVTDAEGRSAGGTITLTVDPATDTDGDGLPNLWELQYGLDPSEAFGDNGAFGDPDGDQSTNAEEFQRDTHPRGTFVRFLAEGATGPFFRTRLALSNAYAWPVTALLGFETNGGIRVTRTVPVPALSAHVVDPAAVPGLEAVEFSTTIEADGPITIDRTMTWDEVGYGSHTETAIQSSSPSWYFAEGSTKGGFDLFYLLFNPGDTTASVNVTYLRTAGGPVVRPYAVPARARLTIWVDRIAGLASEDLAAIVDVASGPDIVVERAMYLSGAQMFQAGHGGSGVAAPATRWHFAEGATGSFFDEFLLMANPASTAAQVQTSYLLPDGTTVTKQYALPARSRLTVWVDAEDPRLSNTAVSAVVESLNLVPIVVERAMWWPGPSAATWTEAHASVGSARTGIRWQVAGGEVGLSPANIDTYFLVANSSAFEGTVNVTLLFDDGTTPLARTFRVPGNSRSNIDVKRAFPAASGKRFGALIESLGANPSRLVVERATYTDAPGVVWAAGAAALAMRLPDSEVLLFSEKGDYVGQGLRWWVTSDGGTLSADRNFDNGVSLRFSGALGNFWYLDFAAPDDVPLVPGRYEGAMRFPFQDPGVAGLSVSGVGRGCNQLTGRFEVTEVVYGTGGEVLRFLATFEQHCEGQPPALRGTVRYVAGG